MWSIIGLPFLGVRVNTAMWIGCGLAIAALLQCIYSCSRLDRQRKRNHERAAALAVEQWEAGESNAGIRQENPI
jgi:hypothetical protein